MSEASSQKLILRAKNIKKAYSISNSASRGLLSALAGRSRSPSERPAFEALKGVDLDIYAGESVGIVGRNGAGKSTLLSIVGGVAEPTSGRIERKCSVATILGTGESFQRDLTGYENAELFCQTRGLSPLQTAEAIDKIEAFADIRDHFHLPLRTYSSGMQARLGFACAANVSADLIIIDEVLAVGDVEFRLKCINHIERQQRRGSTYLIVSHSLGLIASICTRAIVLDGGVKVFDGAARDAAAHYRKMTKEGQIKFAPGESAKDSAAELVSFQHFDPPETGGRSQFRFTIRANAEVQNPEVRIAISDHKGIGASLYRTKVDGPQLPSMSAGQEIAVSASYTNHLNPGRYYYRLSIHTQDEDGERLVAYSDVVGFFDVFGDERGGFVNLDMRGEIAKALEVQPKSA